MDLLFHKYTAGVINQFINFDFLSEGGGVAGERLCKGHSPVEHIGTFIHSSVLPPIHDLRPL